MKKIFILFTVALLLFSCNNTTGGSSTPPVPPVPPVPEVPKSWKKLGETSLKEITRVSALDLAVSTGGTPYILYLGNRAHVLKLDGKDWVEIEKIADDANMGINKGFLAVLKDPYVALDMDNDFMVMLYNSGTWQEESVAGSKLTATSFALAPNGFYIAMGGKNKQITVKTNISGKSPATYFESTLQNATTANETSIVFEQKPYVAFRMDNDFSVTVITYDKNNNLNPLGEEGFTGQVENMSFAVSSNQVPFLCTTSVDEYKLTVQKYTGTSWEPVGSKDFATIDVSNIKPSLALYEDTPYVAFADTTGKKLSVMTYDGSRWNHVGEQSFFSEGVAAVKLAIDQKGTLYVAYTNEHDGSIIVSKFD